MANKIEEKSEKNMGSIFRVQCALPNMESEAMLDKIIAMNKEKNQKKIEMLGSDIG